jgi:Glycosyl transferase family 2
MNKPVVSVVMVVRNVERFLAESIKSILDQSFREFELVIIDFGSTDTTEAIVSSCAVNDSRIKFHTIPHCSLPEARNASCSAAQGKYLAVMDADDIALGHRLATQVSFMEQHPEVGVVGGGIEWINAAGESLPIPYDPANSQDIQSALPRHSPLWRPSPLLRTDVWHPTALIRRDAFYAAGGYRRAFVVSEDYDLWLRIAERHEISNLNHVVLKYRIHPHQVSLQQRRQKSLCKLVAQASAISRRDGQGDPISGLQEITPAVLARLGVSEATQKAILIREYLGYLRTMFVAGAYSATLEAAIEVLQSSDRAGAERWTITELRFLAARIYWRQKKYLTSVATAGHAVVTRPIVLGRPLIRFLHWLRLRTPIQRVYCLFRSLG